jgi:hypothetical protein
MLKVHSRLEPVRWAPATLPTYAQPHDGDDHDPVQGEKPMASREGVFD